MNELDAWQPRANTSCGARGGELVWIRASDNKMAVRSCHVQHLFNKIDCMKFTTVVVHVMQVEARCLRRRKTNTYNGYRPHSSRPVRPNDATRAPVEGEKRRKRAEWKRSGVKYRIPKMSRSRVEINICRNSVPEVWCQTFPRSKTLSSCKGTLSTARNLRNQAWTLELQSVNNAQNFAYVGPQRRKSFWGCASGPYNGRKEGIGKNIMKKTEKEKGWEVGNVRIYWGGENNREHFMKQCIYVQLDVTLNQLLNLKNQSHLWQTFHYCL